VISYDIKLHTALTVYFSNLQHTYPLLATPDANISRWFARGFRSQVRSGILVSSPGKVQNWMRAGGLDHYAIIS